MGQDDAALKRGCDTDTAVQNSLLIAADSQENLLTLEAASVSRSQRLAELGRAISTPLNIILKSAESQMRKKTLPPEIAEALIAIHNSGNVLLNAINNNFDLSGIEAGKIEAEPDGEKAALLAMYPQLAGAFIQDAARARDVLTAILAKRGAYGDDDIRMYTVNVHAMKSVLANMGEKELSAVAARLEQAGRAKDTAVIENESPAFLEKLREIIEKIMPRQNDDDAGEGSGPQPGSEDYAYLSEKLLVIKKACDDYDRKTAKDTIAELRQKKWPQKIAELLGTMARHLLNGDFDEVSNTAEKIQT